MYTTCCFITARHVVAHRAGQRAQTATKQHWTLMIAGLVMSVHHWPRTTYKRHSLPSAQSWSRDISKQSPTRVAARHDWKRPFTASSRRRTNCWQRMQTHSLSLSLSLSLRDQPSCIVYISRWHSLERILILIIYLKIRKRNTVSSTTTKQPQHTDPSHHESRCRLTLIIQTFISFKRHRRQEL